MSTAKLATNFWRAAGLSYLQYLNASTNALRNGLKEPARSRAIARGHLYYNKTVGDVKVGVKSVIPK